MIKTSCSRCIFECEKACFLGRKVILDQNTQFTKGFCRYKRQNNWLESKGNKESLSLNKGIIDKEESGITAIILNANNPEQFKITLDSIKECPAIKEVLVHVNNLGKQEIGAYVDMLENNEFKWGIENHFNVDDLNSFGQNIDGSLDISENQWFLSLVSGETISKKEMDIFNEQIYNVDSSFLATLENDSSINIYNNIINKSAFQSVDGDSGEGFFAKLNYIDPEWESSCLKV